MRRLHTRMIYEYRRHVPSAALILQRFTELAAYDDTTFDELAEFWLIEPSDTVEALEAATQLRIVLTGSATPAIPTRTSAPPGRCWKPTTTCYEMVFITNDAGYGIVLWIPQYGTDASLLAMCQHYATPAPPVVVTTWSSVITRPVPSSPSFFPL